jgi:hypothetical protein
MKADSITFFCDAKGCHVMEWQIKRHIASRWEHFCPLHVRATS